MPDHPEYDAKIQQIASDLSGVSAKVETLVRLVYVGDQVGAGSILNRLTKIEAALKTGYERRSADKQLRFLIWGGLIAFVANVVILIAQYSMTAADAVGAIAKP